MRPTLSHSWGRSTKEAIELQEELSPLVIVEDRLPERIRTVAGVDAAYKDESSLGCAAVVVIDVTTGKIEEVASAVGRSEFPYVSGLLSFREIPVLTTVFAKLSMKPDLLVCDGQGIAHPRRFGLACHIGVIYDLPTIGCAKTSLVGNAVEPGFKRGSFSPIIHRGETVGSLLRTRDGVRPLYISPGHRISLPTGREWILRLSSRYRIPEPIRIADQLVKKMNAELGSQKVS